MADVIFCIPETAPIRYRHCTHASISPDGRVSVGEMTRIGILGFVIDAIAPAQNEEGLLAAMEEEDRLLSLPLTEAQLRALAAEPWCGERCD